MFHGARGGRRRLRIGGPALLLVGLLSPIEVAAERDRDTRPAESGTETGTQEAIEVRLEQAAILVRDRRGRPVADLTRDEIEIRRGGRTLPVAFLEAAGREPVEGPRGVRLFVAAPGRPSTVVPDESAGARHLILLVDVENDAPLLRRQASERAMQFVRTARGAVDRIAVFVYDGEVHLEQSFTDDGEALAQAVARAYLRSPRPRPDVRARARQLIRQLEVCSVDAGGALGGVDDGCLRGVALEHADAARAEAEDYLRALERLVALAGTSPQAIPLVALSHGVPIDVRREITEAVRAIHGDGPSAAALQLALDPGEGATARMDRVVEMAARNGVALTFVDRNPPPVSGGGARQGAPSRGGTWPVRAFHDAPGDGLREMARRTGGAVLKTTDVGEGLARAIGHERGRYVVGYYLDEADAVDPGRPARVSIRRRGVRVTHVRRVRPPVTIDRSSRPAIASLDLGAPLPSDDAPGGGRFIPFTLTLGPGTTESAEGDPAPTAVHLRVESVDGRAHAASFHLVEPNRSHGSTASPGSTPIVIPGWVELPEGEFRLVARVTRATDRGATELSRRLSGSFAHGGPRPTALGRSVP